MEGKDNKYDVNKSLISKDKLIPLQSPLIMGIVNVTPNSFFKGSRKNNVEEAMNEVRAMINEGVDIIDVGGISTRSGADLLSEKIELERVLPVIYAIREEFPEVWISIDTFRANVAEKAVEAGVDIINDVYGGRYDANMFDAVAKLNVPYILMHSRGVAGNMQQQCNYTNLMDEVIYELDVSIQKLRAKGVKDIIVDPGFGFAKNIDQNYELLQKISYFELLDCPVLIGVSRKSMIYNLLGSNPEEALNGTTVLNTIAAIENASILRVHDIKEAMEVTKIVAKLAGKKKIWN